MVEIETRLGKAVLLAAILFMLVLFLLPWQEVSGNPCGKSKYCYLDRMHRK